MEYIRWAFIHEYLELRMFKEELIDFLPLSLLLKDTFLCPPVFHVSFSGLTLNPIILAGDLAGIFAMPPSSHAPMVSGMYQIPFFPWLSFLFNLPFILTSPRTGSLWLFN